MSLSLKRKLDYHYRYFSKEKISPDPLEFLHKYSKFEDIEIIGFLASVFAYGNVKQIINILSEIEKILSGEPYNFVLNFNNKKDGKYFSNLKHRFYSGEDIISLFGILNLVYSNYSTLRDLFLLYYFDDESNLKSTISCFSQNLLHLCDKCNGGSTYRSGIKFMFPDPLKGSACKRMNLFLRWMVRKDELDLGLWSEIPTHKLIIPVDTHVARICRELKLTKSKNVSWIMAEEITQNLKKYDPIDPVKYDFAICHIGMRKLKF
ncbi:MAG: TIGR02757 family protein [Ignavibacteriales bacterium]|nr:TIGR02757 family protein [Ignavibacteriales bacterium]